MGRKPIRKCGKAKKWEELFQDSDDEDDDEDDAKGHQQFGRSHNHHVRLNVESLGAMFEEQRPIHNRLAAMSLEDSNLIFTPCGCGRSAQAATKIQHYRNGNIQREVNTIRDQIASRHHQSVSAKAHFPPGSQRKPKRQVLRHPRSAPSFSPHGSSSSSSSSSSDSDSGPVDPRRRHKRSGRRHTGFSLLDSHKTVEEELSEEEMTNEQMEAIIFMRKPATTTVNKSLVPVPPSEKELKSCRAALPLAQSKSTSIESSGTKSPPVSQVSDFLSKPKIIPTEPVKEDLDLSSSSCIASPPREEVTFSFDAKNSPIIIPTEPMSSSSPEMKKDKSEPPFSSSSTSPSPSAPSAPTTPFIKNPEISHVKIPAKAPKSILKKSTPLSVISPSVTERTSSDSKAVPSISSTQSTLDSIASIPLPPPLPSVPLPPPPPLPPALRQSIAVPPTAPPTSVALDDTSVACSDNEMGDVDMRINPYHSTMSSPFSTAKSPPRSCAPVPTHPQTEVDPPASSLPSSSPCTSAPSSSIWSQGSWLAPSDFSSATSPNMKSTSLPKPNKNFQLDLSRHQLPPPRSFSPPSPISSSLPHSPSQAQLDLDLTSAFPDASPPSNSPPSPPSPLSPPESPSSPSSPVISSETLESPASPTQSPLHCRFRSAPIAIPTDRVKPPESPISTQSPATFAMGNGDRVKRSGDHSSAFSTSRARRESGNENDRSAENVNDMMDFLNSTVTSFDSDSPFEDER